MTEMREFGHEEASPRQVDRHVIDAAAHIAQRNLCFKLERGCLRRLGNRITTRGWQRHGGEEQRDDHPKSIQHNHTLSLSA